MLFVAVVLFTAQLQAVLIPGPPGPYAVSYGVHDLTDESRWDIYAPSNDSHKRRIIVSSYLPITKSEECASAQLSLMPPQTSIEYGRYAADNGLPNDIFQDIQLEFCQPPVCNRNKHARFPLVVFSPGLSASRLLYSNQARVLASYGFIVMTVDHPYDATFVEFPDGSFVRGTVGYTDEESNIATEVRAQDVSFVINLFQHSAPGASLGRNLTHKADMSKIFVYGHSLGGATAAEVALLDERVLGGIDVDGSPWAQSKRVGLDKPFLMSGKGTANGVDETWAPFYEKLRGPKMQLRVEGATHYSYTDIPVILGVRPLPPKYDDLVKYLIGTVKGSQMERIVATLLTSFGSFVFDSDSESLVALNKTFPEIYVVGEQLSVDRI